MFRIRQEQMDALGMDVMERFVEKMMSLFALVWPARTAALGPGYRRFIESAIKSAQSYGIDTESSIARFINLCLVWGLHFERRPEHDWALSVLQDQTLRSALKVDNTPTRVPHAGRSTGSYGKHCRISVFVELNRHRHL